MLNVTAVERKTGATLTPLLQQKGVFILFLQELGPKNDRKNIQIV